MAATRARPITKKKPATKKPATKKPATKKPATKKPATKTPAKKKPAKKQPATKKPATKQPATKKPAATRRPARKQPPAQSVEPLLARLESWCEAQRGHEVRLLRRPPLSEAELDAIPSLLTSFPFPLPTPYEPARFRLPAGYRELLRRAGGLQVEHRGGPDEAWRVWPVVSLYRPGDCSQAHQGQGKTLADSWTVIGTSVDDRAFTTTDFISFADAGFAVEASRWCFYLGGEPGAPLPIYIEDNDFECLLGRFVDTGEWISSLHDPVFPSFEAWLAALVEVVCSRPFDPGQNDATVNAIIERGATAR